MQGAGYIAWQGHVTGAVFIIPVNGEPTIIGALPIGCHRILLAKTCQKMIGMFFSHIFDGKIIDNKAKCDRTGDVFEKSGSSGSFDVTMGGKMLDQSLVGQNASLGKAIHTSVNLDHDVAIVDERCEVVLFNDDIGNPLDRDVHQFGAFHGSASIEILGISIHALGTRCGHNTAMSSVVGVATLPG
eukprot:scaffold32950_cov66-Attheya_sp.AAC.1